MSEDHIAMLYAVSPLDSVKIHLKAHIPVATIPSGIPLNFMDSLLPIFARSTYVKSQQIRFTCRDVYFPDSVTLTMVDRVTSLQTCTQAVQHIFNLLSQQPQISAQWDSWINAPYEKILGHFDIPLKFG